MTPRAAIVLPLLLGSVAGTATATDLRDRPRILLVAAPSPDDPTLVRQHEILEDWRQGAADRDVRVVDIVGSATADARALAARYRLPRDRFAVILIAKDGHVALRSATVLPAAQLEATIDAMPMRRAGER